MLDIAYYPFLSCNRFAESSPQHYGTLKWKSPECTLEYNGQTLLTHCHGRGTLEYRELSDCVAYRGHFYTSNKQGYGVISYPSKDEFQGLFKNSIPFGPGVFTQANGYQSRGFWVGDQLMRLSDMCFDHIVPSLAESPAGKKKLQLYYQTLIDLTEPKEDRVTDALKAFHAPPEVVKNIHFLYNYHLKDPDCLTFDEKPYLKAFYGSVGYKFEEELLEPDEETEGADEPETTSPDEVKPKEKEEKKNKEKKEEGEEENETKKEEKKKEMEEEKKEKEEENETKKEEKKKEMEEEKKEEEEEESKTNEEEKKKKDEENETKKEEEDDDDDKKKKKNLPVPTHLLAWNNSHLIIKIQTHCFKNRQYENFLPADIRGILEHVVDIPRPAGDHQTECYMFLNACASGDAYLADAMVKVYDISPDVSDGCGNTGCFFAAAEDNLDLIDVLSRSGANLDLCNDEGFTALTLCLTRFLAVINKVESWEKAFLPPEYKKIHEGAVILKWPPGKIVRVPKVVDKVPEVPVQRKRAKGKIPKLSETPAIQRHPEFIFNLDPIPHPEDKKGRKKSRVSQKNKKNKAKAKEEEAKRLLEEEEMKERARVIVKTVVQLLNRGANPNNSDVPRPPLILAIYSKDIELVKILLEMEADPNRPTALTDGGLSPLHVLALMVPCQETLEMCELLLEYGGNPDVRAKMEYSEDDKAFDFTDEGDCKCNGKNVLHALCMRQDANLDKTQFLRTMLQMLVEKGNANCEALYLGNSPLTLAMIRGNMELFKALLETRKANPNQLLTSKVAVPLGILMTRSGTDKLPPNDVIEMCNDLLNYGADPLLIIKIEDRFEGNLVELGYEELDRMVAEEKATKHSGKKKEDPVKHYRKLVELVREGATQSIVETMQKKMARVLLHAVLEREAMYLPTSLQFAASWLTTEKLIEHWITFTSEAQLVLNRDDIEDVLLSVDLMESESREDQVDDVFEALSDVLSPDSQELLEQLTPEARKEKAGSKSKQGTLPSDIDMTAKKYQVCFECGRRVGPEAITCSICNIIMFCSENCKQISDEKEGLHKCLGWAERLKSIGRRNFQDAFLKKGGKGAKRRGTKGKEMADLQRLLQDSEMALKGETEEKKKKKKKSGVSEEEEEEGDGKSKRKKKKSAAKDGEEKKLEDESEVDEKDEKKKGKKGGKDKRKQRKGKEGDSDMTTDDERKKKAGSRKGKKGSVSSFGSTDEEGGRRSKRKGRKSESSEEDVDKRGRRKRSSRHGKREHSTERSRAEQRAHSERRETARDRKTTLKSGELDDEELDRYENFLLYVSGSAARGMDLRKLLLPYAVLRDGSLYYKLYGERPLYVENYSHN